VSALPPDTWGLKPVFEKEPMKLPTSDEIQAASSAFEALGSCSSEVLALTRLVREDPTLRADTDRICAWFVDMTHPAEVLARGSVVSAIRRALYYGMAIGEARCEMRGAA
jgi:hypothetical protein